MGEAALIGRAQRGDSVALAQLLQQYYLSVKKYLVTITADRALAEDLTQETMIRAIQRIGQYGGRAKFSTWLISIATHLYMDWLRRQKRERNYLQTALEEEPRAGADREAWEEVLERLDEMPRDVALPVMLKHYYGYTYEEIAGFMGIPEGTVKSRIFNGVRALRKELSAHGE